MKLIAHRHMNRRNRNFMKKSLVALFTIIAGERGYRGKKEVK